MAEHSRDLVAAVVELDRQLKEAGQAAAAERGRAQAMAMEADAQRARADALEAQLAEVVGTPQAGGPPNLSEPNNVEEPVTDPAAAPAPEEEPAAVPVEEEEPLPDGATLVEEGTTVVTSSDPAQLKPAERMEATDGSQLLVAAAPGPVSANAEARTITGRILPFGQVGATNMGRFTFGPGSVQIPEDVSEVKLLVEHSQRDSVGYATAIQEREDGLWATFHVPAGDPDGDLALTRAANRVRNAFSVGVDLDAATLENSRRARDARAIKASGALRETSLVSVPAFTGARVTDVAASTDQLVVAAWAPTIDASREGTQSMDCQLCGHSHPAGTPCSTTQAAAATTTAPAAIPAQAQPITQDQLQAALMGLLGVPADQAAATAPETPAAVPAVAGQATASTQVGQEPPTYTFDGRGRSFIRDAWAARMEGNAEAMANVARFGRELELGGPVVEHIIRASQPELMTAAVETRTTAPEAVDAETYRGDQLVAAIDRGRPMFSRLRSIRLTDATPFKVPTEGEFDGVGAHTEGTAHVPEGTLELGSAVISPRAVSGAYRFSRELADASNPAIDAIAVRAMLRDYRRESEALIAAQLALNVDGSARAVTTDLVDTAAELRSQLISMTLANNDVPPDFAFAGATAFTSYATELAGDGRPTLPPLNPTNAVGSANIRQLALNLDGMPLAATSGIPATEVFMVVGEDVLVGESNVLQFRFDQPEGPGIIKVALWAYQVAKVLRNAGIRRLASNDIGVAGPGV